VKRSSKPETIQRSEARTSSSAKNMAIAKETARPKRSAPPKDDLRNERKKISLNTKSIVLTEAGYRCAVPRCRNILALDMHHMYQVAHGGGDSPSNLIALCSYCHDMYHRGNIPTEAIYTWKSMLVAISRAFDLEAIDSLLFLEPLEKDFLVVSGDGLLHFARLIAAGLADTSMHGYNNGLLVTYTINISEKGRMLITAWREGDRLKLKQVMGGPVPGVGPSGELPAAKLKAR
jgi:hypothetical protein